MGIRNMMFTQSRISVGSRGAAGATCAGPASECQSVMCRPIVPLLVVLLCSGSSRGAAGISDMARTSEFWVIQPFGLSRQIDFPREAVLFRGRLIKTNDWLMPESFVHDDVVVEGVKRIGRVKHIA